MQRQMSLLLELALLVSPVHMSFPSTPTSRWVSACITIVHSVDIAPFCLLRLCSESAQRMLCSSCHVSSVMAVPKAEARAGMCVGSRWPSSSRGLPQAVAHGWAASCSAQWLSESQHTPSSMSSKSLTRMKATSLSSSMHLSSLPLSCPRFCRWDLHVGSAPALSLLPI